jgi:hypothetical protein
MGAFIGYGDTGVWASNAERDAFLDWFAAHRCQPHDTRWEYCMSEANRWGGCGIELEELIPSGEILEVNETEMAEAASAFWPHVGQLLGILSQISRGKWHHLVSSKEAVHWRIG